jgi:rhodanese-related sulfurtransferase
MKTLTTEELRVRLQAGPVALFDVRGDVTFEEGHIPGAKTAPLGSLVFRVADVMSPASFVAVYSANPRDGLAVEAAARLADLGLENVHVYEPGLEGWAAAGLPDVASVDPKVSARGEVLDVRSIVVDRERAYGGAFRDGPGDGAGAGG